MSIVVRSDGEPASMVPAIRNVIESIDPDLPISDVRSMELYGVSPFDPLTLVGVAVMFLGVAAVAGIIPALRASRTPPNVALQSM